MQPTNFSNRMDILIDLKETPKNISRLSFDDLTVISQIIGIVEQITQPEQKLPLHHANNFRQIAFISA